MTVLQFPTPCPSAAILDDTTEVLPDAPTEGGATALVTYLDTQINLPVHSTPDSARPLTSLQARARQIRQVLKWHEIEVLLDVHHVPGQRRSTLLWDILDACARRGAPASHRMFARTVRAHLPVHEKHLMEECLGHEVDIMFEPAPTPA